MHLLIVFTVIAVLSSANAAKDKSCAEPKITDFPKEWKYMNDICVKKMKDQIQKELNAALVYLGMGAHFSKDTVNRPGFAKLFFEAATEEREHAIKLIHYLLMRGQFEQDVTSTINPNKILKMPRTTTWANGTDALTDALNLEAEVTNSIRDVIAYCEDICKNNPGKCENFNDYHLVDYLTGEFLEEQYKGQRDIAGKLSTLKKMVRDHKDLGEFLFDKKLLNVE